MTRRTPGRIVVRSIAVMALGLSLSACSATYRNHGYIPAQEDLDLLAVGIDTRASVEESVGSPSAGGVLEGGDFFYVQSRVRTFGIKEPQVVERQVLAISFDEAGVIRNIERFGLEDGQVVPLARRVTESGITNKTFLRQLLGNLGRLGPASL